MKCLENKSAACAIHEAFENSGEYMGVKNGDAYLLGYFDRIGKDQDNVSLYGVSFKEAVTNFIDQHCYKKSDGNLFICGSAREELDGFIDIFEQQMQRLRSIRSDDKLNKGAE